MTTLDAMHSWDSTSHAFDPAYPLYDARYEHDACGTGFLAQISGQASHMVIQTALQALTNLTHRGAQDADAETSDGAGLLTQIPRTLLCEELLGQHVALANPDDLAVGMIFLPSQDRAPIDYTIPGTRARATVPSIAQVLVTCPQHLPREQFERDLYRARRLIEKRLQEAHIDGCYIASLSCSTVVYKGLLAPNELARFYLDLADPRYASSFA